MGGIIEFYTRFHLTRVYIGGFCTGNGFDQADARSCPDLGSCSGFLVAAERLTDFV